MLPSGSQASVSGSPPSVPYNTRPSSYNMTSRSPQISQSTSTSPHPQHEFTPFKQMISNNSGAATLGAASSGLESLKSLLEAVDTLPFVKYLASVGIQLLQYVIEAQITNDAFKNLAFRAKDVIVAVARSCHGMQTIAAQLEGDLRQLTSTMDSILAFASEKVSRRGYQKLLSKADDSAAVKALNTQLTHAFHIFEIQSSVSTRLIQQQMMQQLFAMSVSPTSPRPEFIGNCNLRVQEGIYMIKNVADGRVIETVDRKPLDFGTVGTVHTYMAPSLEGKLQTQLWSIQKMANKDFEFMIRSMATGLTLEIYNKTSLQGSKVCAHRWNGGGHQIWSFWGTRQGVAEDFCTIRSTGLGTVIDGLCPKDHSKCDEVHATAIPPGRGPNTCQEWSLIRIASLPNTLGLQVPLPEVKFPRRPLLLQNVLTGMLATRDANIQGPNVILASSPTPSSSWTFIYSEIHPGKVLSDCFAIASSSGTPCTMDHYASTHINISKFWLSNDHHKWAPAARDGVFIFRNVASGALLAASRSHARRVDTLPASARDDSACHWRLLDATTNEHVYVLYDSGLSIMPPELSGTPTTSSPPTGMPLELRTGTASPATRLAILDCFEQELDTIRSMLLEGYTALVVAPRMISGWRNGKMKRVEVGRDEAAEFKYRLHVSLHPCEPR